MSFERELIESLECALSTSLGHIAKNAITLSCGHSICRDCIPNDDKFEIECLHCNEINVNNLRLLKETHTFKCLIKNSIEKLFLYMEEKFSTALNDLKECSFEQNLNLKVDFIREEIEMRIDSLKNELDLHRIDLMERLREVKNDILKHNKNNFRSDDLLDKYTFKLNELREDIQLKKSLDSERFFEYQDSLVELDQINNNNLKNDFELFFKPSTFELDLASLGSIEYFNPLNNESKILSSSDLKQLKDLCEFRLSSQWSLLYRGSTDGFRALNFHEKCDNVLNTLTVIKSTSNYIFGGFTTQTWNTCGGYKYDADSFIFSFKNGDCTPLKFKVIDPSHAIMCHSNFGPVFGKNGFDFSIFDNCNQETKNNASNSAFPESYFAFDITREEKFLTGNQFFVVKEIEVFKISNFE